MNLDNFTVKGDCFFSVDEKNAIHDTSFYSLYIGLEQYFKTYNRVWFDLRKNDRSNVNRINQTIQNNDRYIKSYVDIAIHIQHFFELEVKRILRKLHPLFPDEIKDPILLNKLLNNIILSEEEISNVRSLEFSEAFSRLKKLVVKGIISDRVAVLFVNNEKLLTTFATMRNSIMHRGIKILNYCSLDDLFSQNLFPLLLDLLNEPEYAEYKTEYDNLGIVSSIQDIVSEGSKSPVDYSRIAHLKEIARCKYILDSKLCFSSENETDIVDTLVCKQISFNQATLLDDVCPCCGKKAVLAFHEVQRVDIEELGDETSIECGYQTLMVPTYLDYYQCQWCDYTCTDFIVFS